MIPSTAGICPTCGSSNLEYDIPITLEIENKILYPYRCDHCGRNGTEEFEMTFIRHIDNNAL